MYESGPVRFSIELDRLDKRPYRTEVQLYKSLLALKRGIDRNLIITAQREALQAQRVPDERLDLLAEYVKCPE